MPRSLRPALTWVSDCCLRIDLAGSELADRGLVRARVRACMQALRGVDLPGMVDATPAYATVLLTFAPHALDERVVAARVLAALADLDVSAREASTARTVEVPVCYADECALDLATVAAACGLTPAEVIALHSGATYRVAFLGFAPGFPYLDGLPPQLAVPRLSSPRARVPWGSVAIASEQAGIYPHGTAGGWRILGRTPWRLFDARRQPPAMLQLGDGVRFVPIDHAAHLARAAGPL